MLKVHSVALHPSITAEDVFARLRALAEHEGFVVGPKRTLRSLPGSAHWHLHRGRGLGTVELTFDPSGPTVTVALHENRRGTWADQVMGQIALRLQSALAVRDSTAEESVSGAD